MASQPRGNRRGSIPGSLQHAHRRLERLYEISKRLTRFESVERTVPAILEAISDTLPLASAIFLQETHARPRTIVWHGDGSSPDRLRAATAHARSSYAYLLGPRAPARPTDVADGDEPSQERGAEDPRRFVVLPLVIDREPIFGALQLEATARCDESDLLFMNAVANQLAIALARHAAIEERHATAERGQAAAEAGQRVAASRQAAAEDLTARFEALVDNLDRAFVWEADARTLQVFYVTARAETLLGHSRSRWTEERDFWLGCVHPGDQHAVSKMLRKAATEGRDQRCEHRFLTADGRPLWFHTGVHVAGAHTSAPRLQAVSLDITPAKEMEAALRASEEYFYRLAEFVPQKIFTATADGDVDYFNHLWTEFTGLPLEQIRGWGWTRVIHPDDLEQNVRLWRHSIVTGEPFQFEHRFRRADGAFRWHLSRALPLRDGEGKLTMWIGSNTEIDDQKRAEEAERALREQAERAAHARDDVLAGVSHDLRNPLTAISYAAAGLLQRLPSDETTVERRSVGVIERCVAQMRRFIGDLLDISSIEAGRLSIEQRRCAAGALLDEALDAQRDPAVQKSLRLERMLPAGGDIEVHCDRVRAVQVFSNLIGNAIKFTPAAGSITVRVEPRGAEAWFAVTDTGPGIAVEQLPHVFDRFWQAKQTKHLGTGLGLAIAKGIVEAHGGRIWVESEPGVTTTFFFTLPLAAPEAESVVDDDRSEPTRP